MTTPTAAQKWLALFRQRCPRCCDGRIYQRGIQMNERCPICNLRFEREPGYFLGSLYISYGAAVCFLLIEIWLISFVLPTVDLGWIALIAIVGFVPFVPMVTRYARVTWIYFDRWVWPTRPGEDA